MKAHNDWLAEFTSRHILLILLSLATLIGVIFIFIVPPWEHYDEPGHFEYAWLAANQAEWPRAGDYDQSMRREVGASMLEHDFHEYSIYHLLQTSEPISIIIPQTGDVPIYYFIISLPLRLIKHTDMTFQLYVARFVSLGLFVLTIFLAFKSTTLCVPFGHPLRWMVPLFMICLPGFVDIMTAVNNDVGAIAFFTLFVYASLLILARGLSLTRLVFLLLSVILCVLTKSTSTLAAPLSLLIILLALIKRSRAGLLIISVLGIILAIVFLAFSNQNTSPAYFYANKDINLPATVKDDQTPLGKYSIVQEPVEYNYQKFFLVFSTNELDESNDTTLTFGAWIWADKPTEIRSPRIECWKMEQSLPFTSELIPITDTPTYFAFSTTADGELPFFCWVAINSNTKPDNNIYWDGILLAEGNFLELGPPSFLDATAEKAVWGKTTINNLIRNGSGEMSWPIFSPLIEKVLSGRMGISLSNLLSVFDFEHFSWYYKSSLAHIFRSFWGIFGWGNIFLLGTHPYRFFIVLSAIAIVGWVLSIRHRRTTLQTKAVVFFIPMIVLQLIMVLFRGTGTWFASLFIPSARYLFPVTFPISLFLAVGYHNIIKFTKKLLHFPVKILYLLYICGLISSMCWAIISILRF